MGNLKQLIVRNLDPEIVESLKERAKRKGHSAEEEHRAILEAALRKPRKKTFAEALKTMPNVGEDADFERVQDDEENDVFS